MPEYRSICADYIRTTERGHSDEMNIVTGGRVIRKHVEDCEVVLNPDGSSSVLSTIRNAINNEF